MAEVNEKQRKEKEAAAKKPPPKPEAPKPKRPAAPDNGLDPATESEVPSRKP
jgi:hypothetical protein